MIDGLVFPEGPRWHQGALWFSDMHAERVYRWDGDLHEVCRVPGCPSGLGWLGDTLVIASMADRRLWRLQDGLLTPWARIPAPFHINDLLTTPEGHTFVGNFGFDLFGGEPERSTALHVVDPDGSVHVAATDLRFPNGMVLLGDQLLVAETPACRITSFRLRHGRLSDRRIWASLPGLPDGICLDGEGGIWVACPIGGTWEDPRPSCFVRVRDGQVIDTIPTTDGFHATAVALGPELYLLEARHSDPALTGPGNGRIRGRPRSPGR